MPSPLCINEVLSRIDELRSVFDIGQRVMPLVEEVLGFIKEIAPLLDQLDTSIRVSTASMPKATSQLASVTQATELATTEILDLVDALLNKVEDTKAHIGSAGTYLGTLGDTDARLLALLQARLGDDPLLADVAALVAEKTALRDTLARLHQKQTTALNEIRDHVTRIMLSLQVQDITSQQLAGVTHLIESVRNRLALFEGRLGSGTLDVVLDPGPTDGTFDADATYDRSGLKQAVAEAVMAGFSQNAPSGDGTDAASQNDIDDLFAAPPAASDEQASQDDIDQWLTGGAASQGDIDDLFA